MRWLLLILFLVTPAAAFAQEESETPQTEPRFAEAEAAIRKQVEAYVAAFNAADADKLAAIWSPDAVYINRATGEEVTGREAIAGQFKAQFEASQGAKLDVSIASIRFVSPNVAVEEGTAKMLYPEGDPLEIAYSAVYVRRDGQWLLDRVTDEEIPVIPSNYEKLKELEWLVGTWADEHESGGVVTTCGWSTNKNFLVRKFAVSLEGQVEMSGMQIIGWDPVKESIRSWVFDSTGGFAEGTWTQKGDRWMIRLSGYSADGAKTSAVNMITKIDDDTHTFQSVSRTAGGELLPNLAEVVVVRQ